MQANLLHLCGYLSAVKKITRLFGYGLFLATLATLFLIPSCCQKKQEVTGAVPVDSIGIRLSGGDGGLSSHEEGGVLRYSGEGVESGTSYTKHHVEFRKGADTISETIGHVGPGIAITRKARYGNFYLVDFPIGPGQLKLGWLPQDDVSHTPAPTPAASTSAKPKIGHPAGKKP